MTEHWRDWRLPGGVPVSPLGDEGGISTVAADKYVGFPEGKAQFWFNRYDCSGELVVQYGSDIKNIVARRPIPDTWEEAEAWLRMVAAMLPNNHGPT